MILKKHYNGLNWPLFEVTCWKRMSRSKVTGSLGLQTGGIEYSRLGGDVQGSSFTVYVPE